MSISNLSPTNPFPLLKRPTIQKFGSQQQRVFDSFQKKTTEPSIDVSATKGLFDKLSDPFLAHQLSKEHKITGETISQRMEMFDQVYDALDRQGRDHLKSLLKEGVLVDHSADDNHSALFHLYALLSTPRARGFNNKTLLNETVRILNKPYLITQKFPPLSETIAKQILQVRNYPGLNRSKEPTPLKPLGWNDLKVEYSSDCVPSSVMYYMADKMPSELARHLNELTSPLEAFYEKAKLSEISPDDPKQALDILKYYDISYIQTSPDEVTVKVELPIAGKYRAINDSQKHRNDSRTGIETAYQSALAYLPTRSYDPATGQRDATEAVIAVVQQLKSISDPEKQKLIDILQSNKSPAKTYPVFLDHLLKLQSKLTREEKTSIEEAMSQESKGLTEAEKTLMETIIKDNGGVTSVTYQVVAGKENPQAGEESQSYLYGYTRTFDEATADIIEALKMGEFVIIGTTHNDHGAIVGGHEITITSAFVDKKDSEIKFVVVDSDDGIPQPVIRSAKELIPTIHHAGLPTKLAKRINQEIEKVPGYYVPNQEDESHYQSVDILHEPLPPDAFGAPPAHEDQESKAIEANSLATPKKSSPSPEEKEAPKTPQKPPSTPLAPPTQPQIEYIPVYYPTYLPPINYPNPYYYPSYPTPSYYKPIQSPYSYYPQTIPAYPYPYTAYTTRSTVVV